MPYYYETKEKNAFITGCVLTYGSATREMRELWLEVFNKPMENLTGSPKQRFLAAIRLFENAINSGKAPSLERDLRQAIASDEDMSSIVDETLLKPKKLLPLDVDDVSPSDFKDAIWAEAAHRARDEAVEPDLDDFLRGVISRVMTKMKWERRINVGENRHFRRMHQWLMEVQEESRTDHGYGVRVKNKSGRGRVASAPTSPHGLKIKLQSKWF